MRLLCCCFLLTACGRLGFESAPSHADAAMVRVDAAPESYADRVIQSGPLVYYRLDETSGTVAADAMPGRRDATYEFDTGVVTHAQPGALSDGTTGVRVDADGNLGPTITAAVRFDTAYGNWAGDFTLELFVKPHTAPPSGWHNAILICETYLMDGFRFGWTPEGFLNVWTDEAGANGGLPTTATLDYSRFNHVAVTRRGNRFSIFLDATLVATDPTFDYIPTVNETSECGIGSFHGVPSKATFDELALYDRALDAAELAAHLSAR